MKVVNLFWNQEERRLRALWRLSIQFVIFVVAYMLPVLILNRFKNPYTRNLADEIITLTLVLASIWLVVRFIDRRKFVDLGFKINRQWVIDFLQGMLIGGVVFLIVFITEYSLGWLKISVVTKLSDKIYLLEWVGRLIGYIAVATMEETFSRGYQLRNIAEGLDGILKERKNAVIVALFASSVIFGAAHLLNPNSSFLSTFNLFLIGLFYGYAFVISGSLALPIGIHAAWNFVQGNIFGFTVSGLGLEVSLLRSNQFGPKLFTGGAFGPEAGILIYPGIIGGLLLLNKLAHGGLFKFNLREDIARYTPYQKES